MLTLYWYPRCTTCKKAKKWLDDHQLAYQLIDMIQEPPTEQQLAAWMTDSDFPVRRFFNTSGLKYRELGLKDQIAAFSLQEAAHLLSTDGMLIKRPLLVKDGKLLALGFKEADYAAVTA